MGEQGSRRAEERKGPDRFPKKRAIEVNVGLEV